MKFEITVLIETYAKNKNDGLRLKTVTDRIMECFALPKYTLTWTGPGAFTVSEQGTGKCVYTAEDARRARFGWADDVVITIHNDDTVSVYSLPLNQTITSVGPYKRYAISPEGDRMVAINKNGKAKLIDLRNGDVLGVFESDRGDISEVSYAPNGDYIVAITGESGYILDRENLSYIRRIDYGNPIHSLEISPDKRFAIINGDLCNAELGGIRPVKLRISDEAEAEKANHRKCEDIYSSDAEWDYSISRWERCFRFSPDSSYLLMVADVKSTEYNVCDGRYFTSDSSNIYVFDAKRLIEICVLNKGGYTEALFSPDGLYIAGRTKDCIKLWKCGTWELCAELLMDSKGISFSRDGKYLMVSQ